MAKKNKKPSGEGPGPIAADQQPDATKSTPGLTAKKSGKSSPSPAPQSPAPTLVICRNKHWRYISSFHGPWLQLPLEVLETLANANYYMPLPRPVDPAVFYDLVKIRQLVDGATDLAVRAASGVTSANMSSSLAGGSAQHLLGIGFNGGGMKLSPERRFRLREQATQKLSRAYHVDEIASSVATMQSTSTLENVAGLVLQRSPDDPDANYVHFFHEKIPSRQLAECTELDVLNRVIEQRPSDCEPVRTRAIVRMFKEDFEGAATDLSHALAICRLHNKPAHKPEHMQLEKRIGRRRDTPALDERDQPSSTEVQLLFQRAGCYLTLACDHVERALSKAAAQRNGNGSVQNATNGMKQMELNASNETPASEMPPSLGEENGPTKKQLEHRKTVRLCAKRALRDYMDYLKSLHYSPDLPIDVSDDFTKQVNQAAHRTRRYHRNGFQDPNSPAGSADPHKVYLLSDLFSATPPAELPPYPSMDLVSTAYQDPYETTAEAVTYHPLLTEAVHSLLLCHALIQTSAKELQRHAHMVARIARLADGYPVFQASRSPARADWIEVLRRAENWIELSSSWEALCAPAPLPIPINTNGSGTLSAAAASANAMALTSGAPAVETDEQCKERLRHQAIIEALEDDRVTDEASFKAAILARQRRAEAELGNGGNGNGIGNGIVNGNGNASAPKRWAVDDGREYPILTERAEAVARWVREAPAGSGVGTGRRKKKPGTSKKAPVTQADAPVENQVSDVILAKEVPAG